MSFPMSFSINLRPEKKFEFGKKSNKIDGPINYQSIDLKNYSFGYNRKEYWDKYQCYDEDYDWRENVELLDYLHFDLIYKD